MVRVLIFRHNLFHKLVTCLLPANTAHDTVFTLFEIQYYEYRKEHNTLQPNINSNINAKFQRISNSIFLDISKIPPVALGILLSVCWLMMLPRHGQFAPQGYGWQDLKRGLLNIDTHQIFKL